MKTFIFFVSCILYCSICGAQPVQPANRWGQIKVYYLSDLESLAINYFYRYFQYPATVDDLIRHTERSYLFNPYLGDFKRFYWKDMIPALKKEREHLRVTIDTGITYYYTDLVDSLEHLRPEKEAYFYMFFDKDTLFKFPAAEYIGPCEAVSRIGVSLPDYQFRCGMFEGPLLYDSAGNTSYLLDKESNKFRKKFQKLKEKYLSKSKDSTFVYPVYYYMYDGDCIYDRERVFVSRFVEYKNAELYDYCTGETITHESLFNEKLVEFLKQYAKKNKCAKIRFMMTHYNADGKSVKVKY